MAEAGLASADDAKELHELRILCRKQEEQLKANEDQRASLETRNAELKQALQESEAMLAQQKKNEDAIEQGMKKLIESDMQEKQKRADLEEKLDLSNARYTQQKKDADAAVKDREELGHELTLIVEERLTLWDSLDGYHRAVVEVHANPKLPLPASAPQSSESVPTNHDHGAQVIRELWSSLEGWRRELAELAVLRTRDLSMSNYASQQMGLLRRLTGHKHRLEGQIKELKANREADRGGEETPERRRSSVGYDMSPRVSVGDGWHLDYSEADRECQRQDRAWLTQQKDDPSKEAVEEHLEKILINPEHPIGRCIVEFSQGTAPHIVDLCDQGCTEVARAVEPVKAFLEMILDTCQTAYPFLHQEEMMAVALPVLEKIVLSPFYEHIYEIFCAAYAEEDRRCKRSVQSLQDQDAETMGVRRRYCEGAEPGPAGIAGKYTPAVEHLRGMVRKQSPLEKAQVIMESCKQLMRLSESGEMMGADDLLPLLVFCVVKADLKHLAAEMHYIEEFVLEEMACGEPGYFMMCGSSVLGYLLEAEARLPAPS